MNKLVVFFQQPLNQAALAAMAGTGLAVLQGSMTWQHAVPMAAGALIALVIPDNSLAKEDIEQIVADAIKAASDLNSGSK